MSHFHHIPIAAIAQETSDCISLTLAIPQELHDTFAYKQGQHLTLRAQINGEEVRRSYSLCSSPTEHQWQIAIKQIEGGVFSTYAHTTLAVGDCIEVAPPAGTFFTEVAPQVAKRYVAFAAGSGITPILSILKTHLALESESSFQLFFLNKTVQSIIFKETLENIRNTYLGRVEIFYLFTQEHRDVPLFNGRFTVSKMQELTQKIIDVSNTDDCFICGPKDMIFLIKDALVTAGMDAQNIHYELFFSGIAAKKQPQITSKTTTQATEVTMVATGKELHFVMHTADGTLLDGALAAGADVPYACKGGVCSTCKCKVVEGAVTMKVNYALEVEDVNNGWVLSCQAIPTTPKVVVDFDI